MAAAFHSQAAAAGFANAGHVESLARWSGGPTGAGGIDDYRYRLSNAGACVRPDNENITDPRNEGSFDANLYNTRRCWLGQGRGDLANVWDNTIKIKWKAEGRASCDDVEHIQFSKDNDGRAGWVNVRPSSNDCAALLTNFLIPIKTCDGGRDCQPGQGNDMTEAASMVRLISKSGGTASPIWLGYWDFSTGADPAPPPAPGRPSATAKGGDDIATVRITPGSPQGDRYVASVPLDETNRAFCPVNEKTGGSCIIDGLANGQTYSGEVVAYTEDGSGGWIESEAGSFSVRPLPNPPPAPTIASLIAGDRSVEAKVYGDDGTAARFEVSGQQDGSRALVNCTISDAPLSSATDPKGCTLTGLTNFRETFVTAFAVDEFGQTSALSDSATAIPYPPFPGVASTKCNELTRNCTTTGRLPGGADTAQQSIRGVRTLVPAPPFPGTCTKESVQSGLTPFECSSTLPSYGQWMFTTSAVGTAGPVQKQELITINPPSFEGRDGSITVTCDDTTRTCTTEGTRPSGTTGVVQRASAFDELTQTNGKPNRTAQCSYPTSTSYRCVINLDYGKWDLSTQAKKGDTLLSEDMRTVMINAPEFGNKPGGGSALPGAGGSYAFSCDPWAGNSQACRVEGRTPQKTASVALVAQRTATATTTSSTVRDECRIIGSPATYQCAVDLTRGQWTVTTTAYDAAKKIVARQIETVTIAPPFGDPSVGGSARVECERRSGFSSLHFICVAEGTKINQPALYQLRANLSGSSTKVIGACRWDSTEVWQCRAFPRNARGKWRLTFQAVDEGGVLAQGAVTLKIPGPKQEWSQG